MSRTVTLPGAFVFRASLLLALLGILLFLTEGAPQPAQGATYDPTLEVNYCNRLPATFAATDPDLAGDPSCVDSPSAITNEDFSMELTISGGDSYVASPIVTNIPGSVSNDAAIPDGVKVGGIQYESTVSVLNGTCSTGAITDFVLYDSSTSGSLTVDPPSTANRFASIVDDSNSNLLADEDSAFVTTYPDIYPPLFTPAGGSPITPRARYSGATNVSGIWIMISVFEFLANDLEPYQSSPDDLPHIFGRTSLPTTAETLSIIIAHNPYLETSIPTPVSEICSPTVITMMLLGSAPGAYARGATPSLGTAGISVFSYGERDADADGIGNQSDTCPLTTNIGSDADGDGLDVACDPTPGVNTGSGDHDGDGFANRKDTCPLISNASTQVDSELSEAYAGAAPDGGTLGDNIGDACDPNPLTSYTEGTSTEAFSFDARCIGDTDLDADGFCLGDDLDDGSAAAGGFPTNGGLDQEFRITAADPFGDTVGGGRELYLGTDPLRSCAADNTPNNEAIDAQPGDSDDDGDFDLADYLPSRQYFGVTVPTAPQRFDLAHNQVINVADVLTQMITYNLNQPDCLGRTPPGVASTPIQYLAIDADATGNDARLTGGADTQFCRETTDGATFDVDVIVTTPGIPADELAGFEFVLNYDPAVVQVNSVNTGLLLTADVGSAGAIYAEVPSTDGEMLVGAADVAPGSFDEIGPGVLARITLEAVGVGTTALSFDYVDVYTFLDHPSTPGVYSINEIVGASIAVDQACTADFTNLSANVIPSTNPAGAGRVPINNIPLDALAELHDTVPSAPLGSIPLSSIPLGSIPLSSIPLSSIDVNGTPLSSIPLSSIPLSSIGGWEALLEGTALDNMPPQALTLEMVQAEAPEALVGVTLSQVDLGATSLRGIGVGPLALGSLPLSSIPVPSPYGVWCGIGGYMESELGFDCGAGTDATLNMLDLNVRGAPLSSIPLGSIPLSSIPLSSIPLSSIPLSSIPLSSIPLSSIPLSSIPLSSINVSGVPLSSIPLSSIEVPDSTEDDWCAWLATQGAPDQYTCETLGIEVTDSMQEFLNALLETGDPIASTPLSSIPLSSIPLGSIPLSSIPLSSIPLSSIPLSSIPLSSIDLEHPVFTGVELADIQIIVGQSTYGLCQFLTTYPEAGFTCFDLGITESTDLLSDLVAAIDPLTTSLQASPLGSIPLSSISIQGVPITAIPLGSILLQDVPLSSIPLSSIPLSSIPLSSIELAQTPLGSIPLSSIDPPGAHSTFCEYLASLGTGEFSCSAIGITESVSLNLMVAAMEFASLNPDTALAGIPLSSIPLSSIPLSSIPLSSIPLSSISIGGTPLSSIPLSSINLGVSPLGSIPLSSIPLSSIPLSSIPLSSIPLSSIPLSSIPLSSIQLPGNTLGDAVIGDIDPPGTATSSVCPYFAGFGGYTCGSGGLAGISNASTLQALLEALNAMPGGIEASPLSSIPLSSIQAGFDPASIPLSSIPLSSIPLSSIPLSSIPLSSILMTAISLSSIEWQQMPLCTYLTTVGSHCGALGPNDDLTDLFAEMASQYGTVEDSPLSSIPLSSIPLGSIPLSSIDPEPSPLSSILLSDIPGVSGVVNCGVMDCIAPTTDTLGDAGDAGQILPDARLRDIEAAVSAYLLGDLGFLGNSVLADVFLGMGLTGYEDAMDLFMSLMYRENDIGDKGFDFGSMRLGDLLRGLMDRSDYPWEELPFNDLQPQRFAGSADQTGFTVSFDNVGGTANGTEVIIDLPPGFAHVPGSTSLMLIGQGATIDQIPDPAINGDTITYTLDIPANTEVDISFAVRAGLRLGTFRSDFTVQHGAEVESMTDILDVTVTERFEPENNDPETGPILESDEVLISHISSASDVDYYRIAVPEAGSRVVVSLSHLTRDADLVMYRANNFLPGPDDPVPPPNGIPVEDKGSNVAGQNEAQASEGQEDVNTDGSAIASLSASSGTEDEKVETVSAGAAGYYPIQVSGYNGRFSSEGYVLRVRIIPPQADVECGARTFDFPPGTPGGSLLTSLNSGTKTLFLFNRTRLEAIYGTAEAQSILNALTNPLFINRPEVMGQVLHVDASAAISDAYDDWDTQNQCGTILANTVVDEIAAKVNSLAANVAVQHIVVVGSDEVIPFGRVPDTTRISNEGAFARDFELAAGDDNSTWGAMMNRQVLTDNVYGDRNPIPWLDRHLYVPERAVGRLIETPSEIINSIGDYVAFNGRLDPATLDARPPVPRTSLTTGYDFLTDGAQEVDAHLDGIVDISGEMVSETWTAEDLKEAMNPSGDFPPDIISMNAHFDQYRALPADENARGQDDDVLSTGDIDDDFPAERLKGRIIFSMGCHSGLNVPDTLVDSPTADQLLRLLDWPQVFAQQAAVFVGNTGYGYGDTELVALSEQLMVLVAERLDSTMSVGQAVTFAKQEYFAGLGVYGVYDEKAISQATFYGLPMYRVGPSDVTPPAPPPALPTEPDPATGLEAAAIDFNHTFDPPTTGISGDYYSVDDKTQVTHNHPIQPRTEFDITQPDTTAHGAIITDLTSTDVPDFNVAFAQPVIDKSGNEPITEPGEVIFPTAIQNVSSYTDLSGDRQRLVLMPGQYIDDGPGDGTQRLFTDIEAKVYYSDDDDFTEPQLHGVDASVVGSTASFVVNTSDDSPTTVIRVLILYRDIANPNDWQSVDLVREGLTDRWTGGAQVTGTQLEYMVQAVDHAGNVAVSTNKGDYFDAVPPPALPPIIDVNGSQHPSGWYEGAVTVDVDGDPGVIYYASVDGGPLTPVTGPINVSGDGVHTVRVVGNEDVNPTDVTIVVPIDDDPPVIDAHLEPPPNAAGWNNSDVTVTFTCSDSGSGVDTCLVGPTVVTAEGTTNVPSASEDFLAHLANTSAPVKIDKTDPATNASPVDSDGDTFPNAVSVGATDGGSGPKEIRLTVNGGGTMVFSGASAFVSPLPQPSVTIVHYAQDNADNVGTGVSSMFSVDNCPTVANPGQQNADGDALGDACDNCPTTFTSWVVPPSDSDCDGFTGAVETALGTNPGDACGFTVGAPAQSETWPPDLVESNAINISDVLALKPVFGQTVPPASVRLDVVPNGQINISDVLALKPFFGKSCTP